MCSQIEWWRCEERSTPPRCKGSRSRVLEPGPVSASTKCPRRPVREGCGHGGRCVVARVGVIVLWHIGDTGETVTCQPHVLVRRNETTRKGGGCDT